MEKFRCESYTTQPHESLIIQLDTPSRARATGGWIWIHGFLRRVIGPLLFRDHQPFFLLSLVARPLTSCPTLPFSTHRLRHPFQKCIYLTLVSPLTSFLPTYILSRFFQLGFLPITVSCLMQTPPLQAGTYHHRTTVSHSAERQSIPWRSILFQKWSVSIQYRINLPMAQRWYVSIRIPIFRQVLFKLVLLRFCPLAPVSFRRSRRYLNNYTNDRVSPFLSRYPSALRGRRWNHRWQ